MTAVGTAGRGLPAAKAAALAAQALAAQALAAQAPVARALAARAPEEGLASEARRAAAPQEAGVARPVERLALRAARRELRAAPPVRRAGQPQVHRVLRVERAG